MSTTQTSRQPLGVVSQKKLNIISNSTPKKRTLNASLNTAASTPTSKTTISSNNGKRLTLNLTNARSINTDYKVSNFDTIMNNHLNLKRKSDNTCDMNSLDVSPNLKRARLLRMKLQLAYFKVKTNQIDTKTTNLKYSNRNIFNEPTAPASASVITSFTHTKSTSSKPQLNYPLSAPPSTLAFSNLPFKGIHSFNSNSVTSPSKFAMSRSTTKTSFQRHEQTPQLATFLTKSNKFETNEIKQETTRSQFNETTVDESTIMQNESTSTPLLRRHSMNITADKHDPDSTILQTSMMVSTPIRTRGKHLKPPSMKSFNAANRDDTIDCIDEENVQPQDKTIFEDQEFDENRDDETRLLSSPTRERLLCTPSSTAAAQCLLQLAHR